MYILRVLPDKNKHMDNNELSKILTERLASVVKTQGQGNVATSKGGGSVRLDGKKLVMHKCKKCGVNWIFNHLECRQ